MDTNIQVRRDGYKKRKIVVPDSGKDAFLVSFNRLRRPASIVPDIKDMYDGISRTRCYEKAIRRPSLIN